MKPWRESELRLWYRLIVGTVLACVAFAATLYLLWGN